MEVDFLFQFYLEELIMEHGENINEMRISLFSDLIIRTTHQNPDREDILEEILHSTTSAIRIY